MLEERFQTLHRLRCRPYAALLVDICFVPLMRGEVEIICLSVHVRRDVFLYSLDILASPDP